MSATAYVRAQVCKRLGHSRKQQKPSPPRGLRECEGFVKMKAEQNSGLHVVGTPGVTVEEMHTELCKLKGA